MGQLSSKEFEGLVRGRAVLPSKCCSQLVSSCGDCLPGFASYLNWRTVAPRIRRGRVEAGRHGRRTGRSRRVGAGFRATSLKGLPFATVEQCCFVFGRVSFLGCQLRRTLVEFSDHITILANFLALCQRLGKMRIDVCRILQPKEQTPETSQACFERHLRQKSHCTHCPGRACK